MSNLATVQAIYQAFGKGDVPAILERLAEDVDWEYGIVPSGVPWLEPRRGRGNIGGFFASLVGLEFHEFAPTTFLEGPGVVVVLIDIEATVKATGKRLSERDEVHIWRFDAAGRVTAFRHAVDSYQHVLALRA